MQYVLESQTPKKIEEIPSVNDALKKINEMKFEAITNFGWDQENEKVKVYITSGLDGVGDLQKDKIVCEFTD